MTEQRAPRVCFVFISINDKSDKTTEWPSKS